ncbi:alpha/beta hydrolase [Paenibacillus nanensis]|uniref:Alpha/beta hydrolase n=1 Tax=Paenibacillus nanensis TaxID=393251 RepID=A0A3A1UVH4_9BACL|nr:alpha/beta hydrolase [Paenibacillus nanensis]RIX51441.1 alpha/beta hydrolase [Paenibacillus nanensis]
MTEQIILLPNGIHLHVQAELTEKPVVLFLHYSGGTLGMWNGVLPLFGSGCSIVAPDFRGHGRSDKPESGYHIEDMADDIFLLLQQLGIAKVHIVGSSMGAEVGLCLAANHPELVQSLVCEGALYNEFGDYGLFDGTAEEIEQEKARVMERMSMRADLVYDSREAYIDALRVSYETQNLWNPVTAKFADSTMELREDGTYGNRYLNRVRMAYMSGYLDLRFEDYYKRVSCPVLFLPSEDEWANEKIRASIKEFGSLVPSYEIGHLPGAMHAFVWMQMPKEAGGMAKAFIDKTEKAAIAG